MLGFCEEVTVETGVTFATGMSSAAEVLVL
jgi:hypothetical protein